MILGAEMNEVEGGQYAVLVSYQVAGDPPDAILTREEMRGTYEEATARLKEFAAKINIPDAHPNR